ncbi:MAG: cyclic nucleotide-binding domain-containing protein [Polyangiaceae bacterium]|nr:cyclic nucleotide-binding domain-containing protein [Polyangiaceae bacterium]
MLAYERAVDLYVRQGYIARAAAMAKVILGVRPSRSDVLERVDAEAARRLLNQQRRTLEEIRLPPIESGPPPAVSPPATPARFTADRPSLLEEAMRLERADDSAADEVRFSDADEAYALPIEVSAPEILGPAGRLASPSTPPRAEELARLSSMPLFTDVVPEALARIVRDSELLDLSDGDALLRTGEPSDALYILVEGAAEVEVPDLPGSTIVLGEGEVVGESCLLEGAERGADVLARGSLRALRLPRELLDALVREHAGVGDVLLELLTRRVLGNLVRTSELFVAFDPGTRLDLARMFEVRRADPGTVLIEQGKRSDGLYVLLAGRLEVETPTGRLELQPGAAVGERSLLSREPAVATVRTSVGCLLLRLPASRFAELAALYPPVLAHLAELETRRV